MLFRYYFFQIKEHQIHEIWVLFQTVFAVLLCLIIFTPVTMIIIPVFCFYTILSQNICNDVGMHGQESKLSFWITEQINKHYFFDQLSNHVTNASKILDILSPGLSLSCLFSMQQKRYRNLCHIIRKLAADGATW